MMKPWSISTTVRNPNRLRGLLAVLQKLEGSPWDASTQRQYQIMLIQRRLYGYGNSQFCGKLPAEMVALINDTTHTLSLAEATEIFNAHNYEDPAMRGRQSINPLKKFGLATTQGGIIHITPLGQLLLQDTYDYEEIFLRTFLKWQLPNPLTRDFSLAKGYCIKPFLGTLHLIRAVNKKETARNGKATGLSIAEFSLFAPTLVHYQRIDATAGEIIAIRDALKKIKCPQNREQHWTAYKEAFAADFLQTKEEKRIHQLLKNLKDYGDNTLRYFRLTRILHLRGNGRYADLEPRRAVEINALLEADNASAADYASEEAYLSRLSDITQPQLPWETEHATRQIIESILREVRETEQRLNKPHAPFPAANTMRAAALSEQVQHLRQYRQQLQEEELARRSQSDAEVTCCIETLDAIFKQEDRPVLLEKLSAFGLQALNDARKVQPNYPVGDDNEPTFTAPAHRPDIECFYKTFNAICEVTMLTSRSQWYNEGQPVMRHLRDFEDKHSTLPSYCLFIAPKLHRDTLNTFWIAVKYEYENRKQRIIPLRISEFTSMLKILLTLREQQRPLSHTDLRRLYDTIMAASSSSSNVKEWVSAIPNIIKKWGDALLA